MTPFFRSELLLDELTSLQGRLASSSMTRFRGQLKLTSKDLKYMFHHSMTSSATRKHRVAEKTWLTLKHLKHSRDPNQVVEVILYPSWHWFRAAHRVP
jgi:hypothetical protein